MRRIGHHVVLLKGATAYEWQVGPLYGRFTFRRFWYRLAGDRTYWTKAVTFGFDSEWKGTR